MATFVNPSGGSEASLVDLFKSDKKTIDAQKVLFAIWKRRDQPNLVREFTELFTKFVDEKRVLNEIEFYLPQLTHIVINLNVNWDQTSLERFVLAIAQSSVHTALQLCFILVAAMEDFQPEDANGMKNPRANFALYCRCSRMLHNVERAVVYGTPTLSAAEENDLATQLTPARYLAFKDVEKNESIDKIIKTADAVSNAGFSNFLFFKRINRKSPLHTKGWKKRFFVVKDHLLICYKNNSTKIPLRSLLLTGCQVEVINNVKYGEFFSVYSQMTNTCFWLRAPDKNQFSTWLGVLQRESTRFPDPIVTGSVKATLSTAAASMGGANDSNGASQEIGMTEGQRRRYRYFLQQRSFVMRLCQIAENLRFMPRHVRKFFLKRELGDMIIPPLAYLPMGRSIDTWNSVIRVLPDDARVFHTKARCPILVLFETENHPDGTDTATFLGSTLNEFNDQEIIIPRMTGPVTELVLDRPDPDSLYDYTPTSTMLSSKSMSANSVWRPEGTGAARAGIAVPENLPLQAKTAADMMGQSMATTLPKSKAYPSTPSYAPGAIAAAAAAAKAAFEAAPATLVGSRFAHKADMLRFASPYGHLNGWKLDGVMAKSNDDLRQEVFTMQLLSFFQIAFQHAQIPAWLYTYKILSTSKSTGLIQLIPDAMSLDELKKSPNYAGSLRAHFEKTYNYNGSGVEPPSFRKAIYEYIKSMAGYSVLCYLLDIKDRHNGNIMIDSEGHIIHIDFGFVLGLAPGKAFSIEKAPFKLTEEMAAVMGGRFSPDFLEYTRQCTQALLVARKYADTICTMLEIMSFNSFYPCFKYNPFAIKEFRARLMLDIPDEDIEYEWNRLVERSYRHSGSGLYDSFQLATNGIAK